MRGQDRAPLAHFRVVPATSLGTNRGARPTTWPAVANVRARRRLGRGADEFGKRNPGPVARRRADDAIEFVLDPFNGPAARFVHGADNAATRFDQFAGTVQARFT